jgi:hypothetical protein
MEGLSSLNSLLEGRISGRKIGREGGNDDWR